MLYQVPGKQYLVAGTSTLLTAGSVNNIAIAVKIKSHPSPQQR